MPTFCVRSAPASPGARRICLGPAVWGGIRSRHSEPKTRARVELACGCCRRGGPGRSTRRKNPPKSRKYRLPGGAARVPYPTPMGCQRAPIPVFWAPNGHLLRPIGPGQSWSPVHLPWTRCIRRYSFPPFGA
eukprot:gene20908-biopygen16149